MLKIIDVLFFYYLQMLSFRNSCQSDHFLLKMYMIRLMTIVMRCSELSVIKLSGTCCSVFGFDNCTFDYFCDHEMVPFSSSTVLSNANLVIYLPKMTMLQSWIDVQDF
eukprot:c15677_g1_i1 orf=70-393(-)